jgi:hypothetical protein
MGSPPLVIGSVSLVSSKEVQGGEEVNQHEGEGEAISHRAHNR